MITKASFHAIQLSSPFCIYYLEPSETPKFEQRIYQIKTTFQLLNLNTSNLKCTENKHIR